MSAKNARSSSSRVVEKTQDKKAKRQEEFVQTCRLLKDSDTLKFVAIADGMLRKFQKNQIQITEACGLSDDQKQLVEQLLNRPTVKRVGDNASYLTFQSILKHKNPNVTNEEVSKQWHALDKEQRKDFINKNRLPKKQKAKKPAKAPAAVASAAGGASTGSK